MSEIATTDVIENDRGPEETTDVDNQNNNDFPKVIIVVVLLACLWMVIGFTVFKYATLTLIMAHFVKILRVNSTSNHNETRPTSLSQICRRCSSTIRNDSIYNSSSTNDDSTAIMVKGQFNPTKKNR